MRRGKVPSSISRMNGPLGELRRIAVGITPAPAEMSEYLAKVRDRAFAVTDQDVERLKEAGISEDEIFEQTVAVAIAEGLRRLDRASEVIG
jgi:alkylhydroperoxidase family enzyme